MHWDHIVDFNYLLFSTWNCGKSTPIRIFGPTGTKRMCDGMLEAHHIDVEFVKRYIEQLPDHITNRPQPEPPIEVEEIPRGGHRRDGQVQGNLTGDCPPAAIGIRTLFLRLQDRQRLWLRGVQWRYGALRCHGRIIQRCRCARS